MPDNPSNMNIFNYDFYISVRKTDTSQALTPSEAENSIQIIELTDTTKIDYTSFSNDMAKFLNRKEVTLKYDDIGIYGNAIQNTRAGFQISNVVAINGQMPTLTRAWFQHPLFLPAGSILECDEAYGFILIDARTRELQTKTYVPLSWTNSYTLTADGNYYIAYKKIDESSLVDTFDDFLSDFTITLPISKDINTIAYVSGAGNDSTGDGTASNPYREISTAISRGYKTIICKNNYKYNPFSLTKQNDIKIIGEQENYSTNDLKKAYIDNSVYLSLGTDNNGKIKISYTPEETSDFYKCLVSQDKDLQDSSSTRSNGYYVTIYSDKDYINSKRYIPVLTSGENVEGTFYYNNGYIYINPYSTDSTSTQFLLLDDSLETNVNLINLVECNNIIFENIKFKHSSDDTFKINKCSNIKIYNCEFAGSSLNNNVAVNNSNITIENCKSYLARNDGYNFHGNGKSIIINSIGANNFDDGISHHENCDSIIIGGEYFGNNKGGVSTPTYSAKGEIIGVYTHDNYYGIYSVSSNDYANSIINANNNLIVDNNVGIYCSQVDGVLYNNKLSNITNLNISNSNVVNYN